MGLVGTTPTRPMRDEDRIREHIATVIARDEAETQTLMSRIQRSCWPGGPGDRTEPSARRWLERWRPARAAGPIPACSCAHGRCAVCN
jgi:hypothetical protein